MDMNHRYEVRCDQQRSEKGAQASAETRELNPPDDSADVVVKVHVPGQKKGFNPDFSDFCRCSVYCDECFRFMWI